MLNRLSRKHLILAGALVAVCCVFALTAALVVLRNAAPGGASALPVVTLDNGQQVLDVWGRANAANSYRFNARVEQTLNPRASAATIGQQTEHLNLGMEGDVQRHSLDGSRARMTLWVEGQSGAAPPVTLVTQNGKTFIQKGDVLEPARDGVGSVAPTTPDNFLDYLRAAERVRPGEPAGSMAGASAENRVAPDFVFDINTAKLFELMNDRVAASGGLRSSLPPSWERMTATGELWLTRDGLPRRQVIRLTMPNASEDYDADVRLTLDLSHFGGVPALPDVKSNGGGTFRIDLIVPQAHGAPMAFTLSTALSQQLLLAVLALAGALLFVAWYRRNRRVGYVVIAISLAGIFVVSSPLKAVQAAQQAAANASNSSVAEALGLSAPAEKTVPAARARSLDEEVIPPNNGLPKCGDGQPGVDTDQDGLTDQQEYCLGSDAAEPDSDGDGVTDGQEVNGFSCSSKTWTTNPLDPDSNRDGKADGLQYPSSISTVGDDANCDVDGDGVPNVWDSDNDNDGVSNSTDLSPYAKTSGYSSTLGLQIDPQGYTGTTYIELQVQPQITEHLRYSTTPLDWPNGDDAGAIRDLDNSKDDIRLVPMLEVETNISPTLFASQYGISIRSESNPTRTVLYAPLQPQSDGGLTKNFYAKIAYASGELTTTVTWKARMLWFVQSKVDTRTSNCPSGAKCTTSSNEVAHIYRNDPFRISGLNVVKSDRFEAAVFGTPQSSLSIEDKYLFQTVVGLNSSFMDYKSLQGQAANASALQEFARRFNTPGTPLGLRFQVPATVTVAVSNTLYSHLDEGIAGTASAINTFLSQYLPHGNQCSSGTDANGNPIRFLCATVAIASEQRLGSRDLRDMAPNSAGDYAVSLGSIPMLTKRNIKTATYERTSGTTWKLMPLARTLNMIRLRYAGIMDARLAELRQSDPELTSEVLMSGQFLLYTAWSTGADRAVEFDGTTLVSISPSGDEAEVTLASVNAVAKVRDLAEFGLVIKQLTEVAKSRTPPSGKIGTAVDRVGKFFESTVGKKISITKPKIDIDLTVTSFGAKVLGGVQGSLLAANLAVSIAQLTCTAQKDTDCQNRLKVAETTLSSLNAVAGVVGVVAAFGGLEAASGGVFKAIKGNLAEASGKAGAAFAVIGTVITIALTWTQFGLAAASGLSAPAYKLALATAIFATIWAIITLIISFIPFGIGGLINAILGLIDTIIGLATGGEQSLASGLLKLFYDVKLGTQIKDPTFVDKGTGWSDPDAGMVAGNIFRTSSMFSATIGLTSDGSESDLEGNYAKGYVVADASGVTGTVTGNAVNAPMNCVGNGDQLACKNDVNAEFKLLKPGVNTRVAYTNFFELKYTYFECGLFCAFRGKAILDTTTQPSGADAAKAKNEIVVDVLPATIDELWNWNTPGLTTNNDFDGDGLNTAEEAQNGSDPRNPDSDSDNLSDAYEVTVLRTDPRLADSDGDGLNDGLEVQFGTDPKRKDSDNDGLTDGEEVYHNAGAGNWTGGWTVTLPGGKVVRVFADPKSADIEGDGLTDSMERANGSSPDAFHTAPLLRLDSQPLTVEPGGAAPTVYVAPGGQVTYTVFLRTGPAAIAGTLSVCLPGSVENKTVGTLYGNRTVAPVVTPNTCGGGNVDTRYAWTFNGGNTLQIGEYFSTTITGIANRTATSSVRTTASATVPNGSGVLTDTTAFVLDADQPGTGGLSGSAALKADASEVTDAVAPLPGIAFSVPAPNAILRRDPAGTTLVVGGASNDATSWITRVEFNGGAGGGFVAANDASPWSYAWQLPADGNYTLQARSFDYVGNLSAITSTQVLVDGTPPTVTLNTPGNLFVRPSLSGTIVLSGTASDNLAGLNFVEISINNAPWTILQNVPLTQSVLNTNWNYLWTLPQTDEASGTYVIRMRATDRAGNESAIPSFNLVVDGLPPTDELSTNIYLGTPDVRAGLALALSGRATDLGNAPLPSRPTPLSGGVDAVLSATTWLQYQTATDGDGGTGIVWLGDINGDARADLAVGTAGSDGGAGRVSIVNGRGGDWPVPPNAEAIFDSTTSFVGAPGAGIGSLVAPAGDVNGDGFYDTLIGDAVNKRAFLVFGRGLPLGANLPLTGPVSSSAWSVFDASSLGSVTSVAGAGDVNGDGFADMLIGVGGAPGNVQKAHLVLGHTGAWYSSVKLDVEAAANLPLPTNATATGVGDMTGDKNADFTVTAANTVYLVAGSGQYATGANQTLSLPGNSIASFSSSDATVRVTALGDVNGDKLTDFAFNNGSAPQVVLGRSSGAWGVSLSLGGYTPAASGFIAAPGDTDGDGINDIAVGVPSNNSAYLILGKVGLGNTPNVQATLTGVSAIASAPYSIGADLNCDMSSDLLILPTASLPAQTNPQLGANTTFAAKQFVSSANLPVAPAQTATTLTAPGVRYVDNDYCDVCANDGRTYLTNAFASISDALITAGPGTQIRVLPGVYGPFNVTQANITIIGVDPDAVFVDAGGAGTAISVTNTFNTRISNLTVRNAVRLIGLNNAGRNYGDGQAGIGTYFDRLVLHSFSSNAIWMDNASSVDISRSTIVGDAASGPHIFVDRSVADSYFPVPSWTTRANAPVNVGTGSSLVGVRTGGSAALYALVASSPITFQLYTTATNTWSAQALPAGVTTVKGMAGGGVFIKAVFGDGTSNNLTYMFTPSTGLWSSCTNAPFTPGAGFAMSEGNANQAAYVLAGGGSAFYLLNCLSGTWTSRTPIPVAPGAGAAMARNLRTGDVYVLVGGNRNTFYRYNVGSDTWTAMPNAPFNANDGAGLAYSNGLWATFGGSTSNIAYFDDAQEKWVSLPFTAAPGTIGAGGGLAALGTTFSGQTLYVLRGGSTNQLFSYGPAGSINGIVPNSHYPPAKVRLTNTAFVGGAVSASTTWLNTAGTQFDFDYVLDGASQFVNAGTFSPTVPGGQIKTFTAAQFVDPTKRVYRVNTGSALTAGHYTARADAYVSPQYCATCANDGRAWGVTAFSSIQAAINSGATRVILLAGLYPEPFYLTHGVQVVGAGAESTIIQPKPGIARFCPGVCPIGQNLDAVPIVTADGVQGASLSRVTIAGYGFNGALTGLRVNNGAALRVSRTIVRDSANGILLSGSTTKAEIVNNTLVNNSNGIMAINSAPVDVRNTHFGNRFAGLWYFTSAPSVIRQYNAYFGQSYPILLNAGATPQTPDGLGEITIDPLFSNAAGNDFRPLPSSPLIDAGNPSDPTPPGAGRTDIGYTESGAASFYVSGAYGPLNANDGLIWNVDAFDKIQPALDAASAYLKSIGCSNPRNPDPFASPRNNGLCDTRVQVGVAAGTYNENVSVPSYVMLRGVSADAVTISGSSGYVVSFNGVVHAELSGVKLVGSIGSTGGVQALNSSNNITITRVLITLGGANGVQFASGSSGSVRFNTLFNSSTAIEATGANSWVDARNNVISGLAGTALSANSGGQLLSRYNLLNSPTNYAGVLTGPGDLVAQNPQFSGFGDFTLRTTSPARDAAEPYLPESTVPVGGGARADMGYREVVAKPLTVLFGKLGSAPCTLGNSGVMLVEIGVAPASSYTLPVTATLPTTWTPLTLDTPGASASFWTGSVVPATGLSRLYTRATDALGNRETTDFDYGRRTFPLFSGAFVGDASAPVVTLSTPASTLNTTAAAIELVGTASDYNGTRFSVATPYFEAVSGGQSTRIVADWVRNGWNGTGPRTFRAVAALPPGTYAVTAQAQDEAGNTGTSGAVAVTLNAPVSPNHVVTFTNISNAGWTNQSTFRVTGAALFASVASGAVVTLQVGSGPVVTATLDNPQALLSAWTADVALVSGNNTVTARASNANGAGVPASITVRLDTVAPALAAPASGSVYTGTVQMAGTTSDADSGIETVEVSVDGGYRWMPATVSGANWSLSWTANIGNVNLSYPSQVRARDRAGNTTVQTFNFIVDDIPPRNFETVSFNIPQGTRLTSTQSLVMTWTTPLDASSIVTTLASIDQISVSVPSAVAVNTLSTPMNLDGQWYAHLSATDRAGNRVSRDFGPWYVNTGAFCSNANVPITLDGVIDTGANEWLATTLLDDDERPSFSGSRVQRDRQMLHAFWGSNAFYLGWRGGYWDVDGALFAYLSTGGAGTTALISPTNASNVLPFAADVAVVITGKTQGTWYRYSAGVWQPQAGLTFKQGDSGDTEIRVPLAVQSLGAVRLLAFARSDDGDAWSVFPTTNQLSAGAWPAGYNWPSICAVIAPNAGQPRGASVLTRLTSLQSSSTPLAPGSPVQLVIALDNRERSLLAGTQLTLTASAGLTYQSAVGPGGFACASCTPGANQFVMTVPSLLSNTVTLVTVTGQLAANVSTIPVVTSTLSAQSAGIGLSGASVTHLTDGVAPTATVLASEPLVVKPGTVLFTGAASDGDGIGVQSVEARAQGSTTWLSATGTSAWVASLTVPNAPTFVLEFRATDRYGQVSALQTRTYVVDTTPPTVTLNLRAAVSGTLMTITGTTADPAPVGVPVDWVDVQIDDGVITTPWLQANGPFSQTTGAQGWSFRWNLPDTEGTVLRVRVRATDGAGNVTTSDWQTITVDTRAPVVQVTTAVTSITGAAPSPVLAGTATDGGGVSRMLARVFAPDGQATVETVVFSGGAWSWTPGATLISGVYQVRIEAIDAAGNVQSVGPILITVGATPVTPTPSPTPGGLSFRVRLPLVSR